MFKPSRLRKNSRMFALLSQVFALPWKSGPSGPRISCEIIAGFSPGGRCRWANRIFPQTAKRLSLTVAVFCAVAAAQSPSLPAGAAQAKVTTACGECHESRIILQQRLSKPAWAKEVDKMIKWGALVDPADRDSFIDYLSANFPADKPAEPMARTAAEKKK
jgi:hypothetical protein